MRAAQELRSALIFRALARAARASAMPERGRGASPPRYATRFDMPACARWSERRSAPGSPCTTRGPCARASRAYRTPGSARWRCSWSRWRSVRRSRCACSAPVVARRGSRSRGRRSRRFCATKYAISASAGPGSRCSCPDSSLPCALPRSAKPRRGSRPASGTPRSRRCGGWSNGDRSIRPTQRWACCTPSAHRSLLFRGRAARRATPDAPRLGWEAGLDGAIPGRLRARRSCHSCGLVPSFL